ncbi:MAG TPA: hypothetical protein V6C72_08515 [Chroococcales cyanobacterium]
MLKDDFVCGYKDIENSRYAGSSGKHRPDEQAVDTTNGAGPHNIQIFVLTADGTVLQCLPGYWHSQDLADELAFAARLNKLYQDPTLTAEQKDQMFSQMQLNRIAEEPQGEHKRSRMQGFDVMYEGKKNLARTDVFYDRSLVDPATGKTPNTNVKTTDIIFHERMAARPFQPYKKFDVASYSDYGKKMYDKHEQFRMADGQIAPGANLSSEPMIGNDPRAHPVQTQVKRQGMRALRTGLWMGIRAAMYR